MRVRQVIRLLASAGILALTACGGSGGESGVASTPTPVPAPPPPAPTPPVKIFETPVAGEYASIGASLAGPGGNLDTFSTPTAFGAISTNDSNQAHIRYTTGGFYEVRLPGSDWDRLVHYRGLQDPTSENNYFEPQSTQTNRAYAITRNSRNQGYSYSELGGWGSQAASRWGYVAFGVLTPSGAMPVTGSASYNGLVSGSSDIMIADNLYGGYVPRAVDGMVALNFDFGGGTLAGSMSLSLGDGMQPLAIGTFAFRDMVFSAGSPTYSGRFDTSAAGQNFFLGRFTGPNAQETIGAWALPFMFTQNGTYVHGDGQTHQAFGAWIAKRP